MAGENANQMGYLKRIADALDGGAASPSLAEIVATLAVPLRINTTASGDTALVAAVASQTTKVHALRLSVAGAVIVQVRNGATVLEEFNFAGPGGGVVFDLRARPYYTTSANTALNLNLSAAVAVDGVLEYVTSA